MFPLNQAFEGPRDRQDAETLRQWVDPATGTPAAHCYRYLSQVRQELAMRLLARVYADGPTPSKVCSCMSNHEQLIAYVPPVVAKLHEAQIHGQILVAAVSYLLLLALSFRSDVAVYRRFHLHKLCLLLSMSPPTSSDSRWAGCFGFYCCWIES